MINENKNYRNKNIQIRDEPKEFGYYISSNSSAQVRLKAQRDKIKVVQINSKYIPIKIGQRPFENKKKEEINKENNQNIKNNN
jgi:hypothetical protein